jgi:molybdopterin synthase catalytic subunit
VRHVIDVAALMAEVGDTANGATVLFLGHVREMNDGREVRGIEYSAYGEMAERALASIAGECAARFGVAHVVAEHRLGALELGDVSIAIAVAHPHRAEAYEASRYIIEEVKRRLPVWKREGYIDGTTEWVNAGGVAHEQSGQEQS